MKIVLSLSKGIACAALVAMLAPAAAFAEVQEGAIDWQRRVVKCKGMGAPRQDAANIAVARIGAEKAAKMDAQRNIIETLKGVTISGSKTVADAMTDPGVSAKVAGTIRNFKVTDTRYFSDGGCEVDVEMPLDGLIEQLAPAPAKKADAAPAAAPAATVAAAAPAAPAPAPLASGLVVETLGVKFEPAMAPRILDEDGNELYGPAVAGYASSLENAKKDARVAGNPVVVKAIALAKGSASDVVVSREDAKKAKGAKLEGGSVVFVVQ